jgi:hypothetical protein
MAVRMHYFYVLPPPYQGTNSFSLARAFQLDNRKHTFM